MIEQMLYINIAGQKGNLDSAINKYISRYDIHIEESEDSFNPVNIYEKHFNTAKKFASLIDEAVFYKAMEEEDAIVLIANIEKSLYEKDTELNNLEEKRKELIGIIDTLENYANLDLNIHDLESLDFLKYRFGRLSETKIKLLNLYLEQTKGVLFLEGAKKDDFIYGVYFVVDTLKEKVDETFSKFNYEVLHIPANYEELDFKGDINSTIATLNAKLETLDDNIAIISEEKLRLIGINKDDIGSAYAKIKTLYYGQNIKKYITKTTEQFFIFSGFISKNDAKILQEEIERDPSIILTIDSSDLTPPTKLKNNKFVKPFELFLKAYGTPKYNEIDPTPFLAVMYTLLFGLMFGDVGQGGIISLIGLWLDRNAKTDNIKNFGKILFQIGISSMVFGVLYGSIFGFEHILPTVWMKPIENINFMLLLSVGLGLVLVATGIILNIINGIKQKDFLKVFVGQNSVLGLVFYIGVIGLFFSILSGRVFLSAFIFFFFVTLPFISILLKEYLTIWLEGTSTEESGGMLALRSGIETFETMLTYFTNTLSFIRVGAFTLSHAGMMGVVFLLSQNRNFGTSFLIILLGNIIVMVLEGFVVGIQVLRLHFYELFSRFFVAGGKEFVEVRKLS